MSSYINIESLISSEGKQFLRNLRKVERVVLILLALIVAGFLILTTSPHRILLYALFVAGVIYLKTSTQHVKIWHIKNNVLILALLFLALNLMSLLWSNIEDYERLWQKTKPTLFLTLFFAILIPYFKRKQQTVSFLNEVYILTATVTGTILLALNANDIINSYILEQRAWRLEAFGRAENSNMAGLFYGIAVLNILFLKAQFFPILQSKYVRAACILISASVFFLTLSRGAFLAFAVTLGAISLFYGLNNRKSMKYVYASAAILGSAACILSLMFPHIISYMIERGSTGRLDLWRMAYEQFTQAPILGHGAGTRFLYELTLNGGRTTVQGHTHNIYLSAMVHTGILGLALLLILCVCVVIGLGSYVKRTKEYSPLIIFMFGLVFGTVDTGGHYYSLNSSWFIFWIPIIQLIAYEQSSKEQKLKTG